MALFLGTVRHRREHLAQPMYEALLKEDGVELPLEVFNAAIACVNSSQQFEEVCESCVCVP